MNDLQPSKLQQSLARFLDILDESDIQSILALQDKPLPAGIRLNPIKVNPHGAIQNLSKRYDWQVSPISFCENGWIINRADISPGNTIEHRMGQYYLQDAASMIPVTLFDIPNTPALILDMAASPGGKTTHLIDRTNDKSFIIANDSSKSRIPALRSVLSAWGGANTAITQYPGESFGSWYPETFDLILLDAPCTMENLRPTENRPVRETTQDERTRLQERQINLLASGLSALKPKGQLVYATCSLAPEEDEAVIDAVIKKYPGSIHITDVSKKNNFSAPGLTHFGQHQFSPDLVHALRLWPHLTGMSGFFCALITKSQPIPFPHASPPEREFSKTSLELTNENLKALVFQQIDLNFGLNLADLLEAYNLILFSRQEQLFLIPEAYLTYFRQLPFEYIGLFLGRWHANVLEPSHEFISRFGHQFARGIIQIKPEHINQWVAGRDIRYPETKLHPHGQYLLVTDKNGRNLGLGRLLPKRLRNMLPRQSI